MKVVGHVGHVRVFMTVGFAARKSMNPRWVDCEKFGDINWLDSGVDSSGSSSKLQHVTTRI
jgi:hypothetical protein